MSTSDMDKEYDRWFGTPPEQSEGLYAQMMRQQKEAEEWIKNQPPLTLEQIMQKLADISNTMRKDTMYGKAQVPGAAVLALNDDWFLSVVRSQNVIVFCGTDTAKAIEERANKLGYNINGTKL